MNPFNRLLDITLLYPAKLSSKAKEGVFQVDIQDLGAIGEFISSIVVLITLVFFTLELRQNTKAVKSATFQEINQDQSRLTRDARAFYDALGQAEGSPLEGTERFKATEFLYNAFKSYETVWYQHRAGNLEDEAFEGHRRWMIWGLGSPMGIVAWEEMSELFHPEFCTFVDELMKELSWRAHPCNRLIHNGSFFQKMAAPKQVQA